VEKTAFRYYTFKGIAMKMTFEQWKDIVNAIIEARWGLSADDLPDYCYYASYVSGDTPLECAKLAVNAAMDY
jgi:hypothetical protein